MAVENSVTSPKRQGAMPSNRKRKMDDSIANQSRIPFCIIPLVIYFGIEGLIGFHSILFDPIPNISLFRGNSEFFNTVLYLKKIYLAFYLIPAVALIFRKVWAQKIGVILLCVDLVFSIVLSVWAFLIFSPPLIAYLGFPLICLWFYFWIHLLKRESVKETLI